MQSCAAFVATLLSVALWGTELRALDLSLPSSAVKTAGIEEDAATYYVPVGAFDGRDVPALRVEGALVQEAWRMDAPGLTTLQILRPLRAQVEDAGYDILFSCPARACGGFDFRFQTRVLPAPDMFVDLLDYHFLSARRGNPANGASYVTLMVSRTASAGYIQVIRLARGKTAVPALTVEPDIITTTGNSEADGPLAQTLLRDGQVVLTGLDFATGTVALGAGPFASLQGIAAFLQEDPARRIALVGHTDSVGGLEPNIALSRRRAQAVLDRLVSLYDIPAAQLEAEGVGYLAPLASNLTAAGRERNRRVEAVLLNTE